MEKLQALSDYLSTLGDDLRSHESLSEDLDAAYAANIDTLRNLRKTITTLSSYIIFLTEIGKPESEWMKEEVQASIEEMGAISNPEIKAHKAVKIRNKNLLKVLDETEVACLQFQSLKDVHEAILVKKEELLQLAKDFKAKAEVFLTDFVNEKLAKEIVKKQFQEIEKLQMEITADTPVAKSLFEDITYDEITRLLEFADMQRKNKCKPAEMESNTDKELSAYQNYASFNIVDNSPTCKILEVFYKKANGVQSSVLVKLIYSQGGDSQPTEISVQNCPIPVDDILNLNVQSFVSELQYRLMMV